MVRRGEYLERAVVVPGKNGTLEGLFHRGAKRPPLLIAPAHPFGGGSMESAIIAELAYAVTKRGHPTLRFNYRGVGASEGSFTDDTAALADALDAADHLRTTTASDSLALAGFGWGGSIVARLALESTAELLILVAPEPDLLPAALASYSEEVVFVCAEQEDSSRKTALSDLSRTMKNGRLAVIPQADRGFVRGLVELGRVVAESIAPPGMLDLS